MFIVNMWTLVLLALSVAHGAAPPFVEPVHSCAFAGDLCGWQPEFFDAEPGHVHFHVGSQPHRDDLTKMTPDQRARLLAANLTDFDGDYMYVEETRLFRLTSPELSLWFEPVDTRGFGVLCLSFSARASHWTRAGLWLLLPPFTSAPAEPRQYTGDPTVRLLWNVDASPDYGWTGYTLNVRLKWQPAKAVSFRLQLEVTPTLPENHVAHLLPEDPVSSVFLGLGALAVRRDTCRHDVINKQDKLVGVSAPRRDEELMSSTSDSQLWPGGVVPYEIASGYFNKTHRSMIRSAMLDIANRSCIRFVPHRHSSAYLEITGMAMGCFAHVGYTGGYSYANIDPTSCFDMRTIRHELLHALGFYHEHQRPDRDQYVDVLWQNVRPMATEQFELYASNEVELFDLPYDYESVMHYGTRTFSYLGDQTIRPKIPWATIGAIQTFSALDTIKMQNLYGCQGKQPTPTWGDYCTTQAGPFLCLRYAPCELGIFECPGPTVFDPYSQVCKSPRSLFEDCSTERHVCTSPHSECRTDMCQCKPGYYAGPRNDCLPNSADKRLGNSCRDAFDCMYELICDSVEQTCRCPTYQTPVGDYGCENNKLDSPCTGHSECALAVPAARCLNGSCQCPEPLNATSYVDPSGAVLAACARSTATVGAECQVDIGDLCSGGAVCRFCPDSIVEMCTLPLEFAVAWNDFPDKPPGFYILAGANRPFVRCFTILAAQLYLTFLSTINC